MTIVHSILSSTTSQLAAHAATCTTEFASVFGLESEKLASLSSNSYVTGVCQVLMGMLLLHVLIYRYKPTFTSEFLLYLIMVAVNIACFDYFYAASTLVATISNYAPSHYFIGFCVILDVVFTFINVIPKYLKFDGAERHKNEMFVKKSYLTKNYIRLFMHIISGILGYCTTGYVWYVSGNISSGFKNAVMVIDVVHEITAWLMIRNHDGAMSLRAGNLGFTVLKQVAVAALFHTDDPQTINSLCTFMFTFTSGFAWTRFNCMIILVISIYGRSKSFDGLREYWYTVGESSAQIIIAFAAGVHGELNLAHAVAFWYFPHENWVSRRNKHFQQRSRILGVLVVLYYFAVPRSYYMVHVTVYHALTYFTYMYCGAFFKRNPLPSVDFKTDIEKEVTSLKKKKTKDENFQQKFINKVLSREAPTVPSKRDETKKTESSSKKEVETLRTRVAELERQSSKNEVEVLQSRVAELEAQLAGRIAHLESQIKNMAELEVMAVLAQQPELTERTSSVGTPLPPSDFELRTLSVDDLPQPALNTTVDDDDQDGLDEDYVAQVEQTLFAVPERMVRQASLELGKQKSSLNLGTQKSSLHLGSKLSSIKLGGHSESSYILFVQNSASRQVSGGF